MYSFECRQSFRKSFYAIENTAELHYRLLNASDFTVHNGYLYCFCNKYEGPPEEFGSDQFCPLCRIPIFLKNFDEFLDQKSIQFLFFGLLFVSTV